jgi:O-antigen/teichoic acid export membrane protein
LFKNVIGSFFARGSVALINLGILLIMSRYLGSAVVGQMSLLVLNLAIVHTISEIYTGSALVYFIPKNSLAKIYSNGIVWLIGCIALTNTIFLFANIGLREFWIHVVVISFISSLHLFHNVILLAKEKIRLYNFLIFFQPAVLILTLIVMVGVYDLKDIYSYVTALYISYTFSLLISAVGVMQELKKSSSNKEPVRLKEIFRNGTTNELGNLAHTLSNRYNYYILETLSLSVVGIYASGSSLIEQSLWMISASVSPLVLTHIANQRDVENNVRLTLSLARICFLLSLCCVIILYFIPTGFFTRLFGNKDFSQLKTIMLYLSPGVMCVSFSSIISHYFSGLGKQRVLLIANCSGLLVTLLGSHFFISRFGLKGACYAASLSYAMQSLVLVIIFLNQNELKIADLFYSKTGTRSPE